MTVQTSASRPAGKSVGAATVGVLLTLIIFAVVFLAFLIAPLIALLLAFLAYTVMRPRANRTTSSGPGSPAGSGQAAQGFGAGAQ
ncbi:hypothetical protein NPS01_23640 [Nocardioides psychrotolerans]|uniref:Uncharacterized protein n=1 Tax=Nocardioides psychrotolerans TaxID=1005945 RepID=A0A1I3HWY7_9ACTN|nr:hypothetical protein [Nocardioides psychrotolerans]GEP38701.1 hypothetical protein NPS01_23640 [Nocardioides psychrotolerans]SFI40107.1 hypothetical protein SAMN05216561_10818 [Nocardioides psychrotolerans]